MVVFMPLKTYNFKMRSAFLLFSSGPNYVGKNLQHLMIDHIAIAIIVMIFKNFKVLFLPISIP